MFILFDILIRLITNQDTLSISKIPNFSFTSRTCCDEKKILYRYTSKWCMVRKEFLRQMFTYCKDLIK